MLSLPWVVEEVLSLPWVVGVGLSSLLEGVVEEGVVEVCPPC